MHRTVVDPKTGRMRTENASLPVSSAELEDLRREVKDIIAGNVKFHTDPNAAPVEERDWTEGEIELILLMSKWIDRTAGFDHGERRHARIGLPPIYWRAMEKTDA